MWKKCVKSEYEINKSLGYINKIMKLIENFPHCFIKIFWIPVHVHVGWTRINRGPTEENDDWGNPEKSTSVPFQAGFDWCHTWTPGPHHRGRDRVRENDSDPPVSASCSKCWVFLVLELCSASNIHGQNMLTCLSQYIMILKFMFRGKLSVKDGMNFPISIYIYLVETLYIVAPMQNQNSEKLYVNQLKRLEI